MAHRFYDRWYIDTYKYTSHGRGKKGLRAVYYSDDKHVYMHQLALTDYGIQGVWVCVRKLTKARRPVNDGNLVDEEESYGD